MFRRHSRIIAAIVICFFTWTSGGLFSVAHAAVDAAKKSRSQGPAEKTEGAEERFAKLTEELTTSLNDPKTGHGEKRQVLLGARGEIDLLDADIRQQFAETEKKLKDAGLPPEILARHQKFVKHYDDNLAELKGNIARVESAKDGAEGEAALEKTRLHLARVKSPSRHQKLDPNNLPHRQPKAIKREPRMKKEDFDKDLKKDKHAWKSAKRIMVASTGSVAGLLPTDDLAETVEVQLTPEIRAKALELGNSPVKIYEWVRNNFKFEPYYGSLKGSQQTLLEMSGNDYDLASLLIALLRAANIPAKYVSGTIEVPIERVMAWLGVKDPKVAADIIASGGIPAKAGLSGGKITSVRLEHVWVEAFVNMYPSFGAKNGPGNAWTPLDPSFKENELNASVDNSKTVKFNESDYLLRQSKIPPSLTYMSALEDYHTANYQGSMHKMFYAKKIKEHEFEVLPGTLPYKTVVVAGKFPSIDDGLRHKITIGLRDPIADASTNVTQNICEITGKKITVSYAPSSEADSAVMANYGGLLKTPAYLVKVKAEVRVDDTVVLEGPAIGMGDSLMLSLQFSSPGSYSESIETDMAAGVYYNIGLSALNVANRQSISGLDTLDGLTGTFYDSINTRDHQAGKVLHNLAMQYFTHTNNASKLLEGLMHIYNTRAVNAGFLSVSAKYREFFGITVSPPIISGLIVDIPRYIQSPFFITGDKEQEKQFTKIQGLNTSFFEHSILESYTGIDSVSTVKLLQLASETGLPIYTINSANLNAILPLLNQTEQVKIDIQNAVNAGREVTIPGRSITLNDWSGTGYIVRSPDTGEGAYMISSGLAGGGSTRPPAGLALLAKSIAAFSIGRPWHHDLKKEKSEYFLELDRDLMTKIGLELLGQRGYIPMFHTDFTSKGMLDILNNPKNDIWIFYYSGHGGCDKAEAASFLAPYPSDHNRGRTCCDYGQWVYPNEIRTDAHIVFLNACLTGMYSGPFETAFGIDQMHNGQPRDEVFLGFDQSVDPEDSSTFGYHWWQYMLQGETAIRAAKLADDPAGTDYACKFEDGEFEATCPDYMPDPCGKVYPPGVDPPEGKLVIKGEPNTRLY